jgi:hypothetical protein
MKNFLNFILAFMAIGLSAAFAQKSSIDSPHNYKRPVFQQQKAMNQTKNMLSLSQSSNKIQNNIRSVHNYKRQKSVDFSSEVSLVVALPTSRTVVLNPLVSSGNYKSHFTATEFGQQVASKNQNNTQISINQSSIFENKVD